MKHDSKWGAVIAGSLAGFVNGLLGAGGGIVLVPLLTKYTICQEEEVFPSSVSIILPICFVSLAFSFAQAEGSFAGVLPYLIGSAIGGVAAGCFGRKIPTQWLHKILGILILWGGMRYLC